MPHGPSITAAELEAMLRDPDVPDSAIRPWLALDPARSDAFDPVVVPAAGRVAGAGGDGLESAFLVAGANEVARWRRRERYRRRIADGWAGLRIVAEGDSWFQYPFLLDDVIDHLSDGAAILCLSGAMHLVREMLDQGELVPAVEAQQPDLILLSGGGNDLLGEGRLARVLPDYRPGEPAQWYLREGGFAAALDDVMAAWAEQLRRVRAVAPDTPILAHSYAHAIPAGGRWLGRPMAMLGIADPALQRAIVAAMIDAFHERLSALVASVGKAAVADCRGVVADRLWDDELHPTSDGYAAVAGVFVGHIRALTGRDFPAVEVNWLESAFAPAPVGPAGEALAAIAGAQAEAVEAEIGARLAAAQAGAPDGPVAISALAREGLLSTLRPQGAALVEQARGAAADAPAGAARATQRAAALCAQGVPADAAWLAAALAERPADAGLESAAEGVALASAAADWARANPAEAEALLVAGGSADASDVAAARPHARLLPAAVVRFLRDKGIPVVVCRESITDHEASLRGVKPRGWPRNPDGTEPTWDQVPGAYLPRRRQVVVATRMRAGVREVATSGHGSTNLLIHEALHAHDREARRRPTETRSFRDAWDRDWPILGDAYYQQERDRRPSAGREESYAESAAYRFGGRPDLLARWPSVAGFWDALAAGALEAAGMTESAATDDAAEAAESVEVAQDDHGAPAAVGVARRLADGSYALLLSADTPEVVGAHALVRVPPGTATHDALATQEAEAAGAAESAGLEAARPASFAVRPFD